MSHRNLSWGAVLLSILLFSPPAAPDDSPLIEVGRIRFDPPFSVLQPYQHDPLSEYEVVDTALAVLDSAPVAFALSQSNLFVVDTTDGTVTEVVDLNGLFPASPELRPQFNLTLAGSGSTAHLVVWNRAWGGGVWSFSLADPRHPVLAWSYDGERDDSIIPLPGGDTLLTVGNPGAVVVSADTGDALGQLGRYDWSPAAVGGSPARPIVAIPDVVESRLGYSFYDVADPGNPIPLSTGIPAHRSTRVLIDRTGEVAVFFDLAEPEHPGLVDIRSVSTGEVIAGIDVGSTPHDAVLAEGGGQRVLALWAGSGLDLYDLSSPATPVLRARFDVAEPDYRRSSNFFFGASLILATSSTDPLLFAITRDRSLLAIDTARGTVTSRYACELPPVAIAIGEGAGGRRDAAVVAARIDYGRVLARGGTSDLRTLDLSDPSNPRQSAVMLRNQPRRISGFAVIDGRRAVAMDSEANSLALFDLRDGTVIDVSGLDGWFPLGQFFSGSGRLEAGGGTVLSLPPNGHYYEVFGLSGDRLVPRLARDFDMDEPQGAAVRPDGTAVVVTVLALETVLPDDRTARVPLAGFGQSLRLSRSGRLALAAMPTLGAYPGAQVFDLTDPAAPVSLWSGYPFFVDGAFLDHDRLFAVDCQGYYHTLQTQLLDGRTGVPIGPTGDPISTGFSWALDNMLEWGEGPDSRVVLWTPTEDGGGRKTDLFDVGGDRPVLLAESPEFGGVPEYLARDGGGWYEIRNPYWSDISALLIGDQAGSQHVAWSEGIEQIQYTIPRSLRRGFLAVVRQGGTDDEILILRDPELNRPPIAEAGADLSLECAGPGGTPAVLDGAGASDPDSWPGTHDDIASFDWTVDGTSAGSGETREVTLGVGSHSVALAVTDQLQATSTDAATITVADTLAPEVTIRLEPVQAGAGSGVWRPLGAASDLCDGRLGTPTETLLLPSSIPSEARFKRAASRSIEIRSTPGRDSVLLYGPDEAQARAAWLAAVAAWGFALRDAQPVSLVLNPRGIGQDNHLLDRYELDPSGLLTGANAYDGRDLVIRAVATDAAGNTGSAEVSVAASDE